MRKENILPDARTIDISTQCPKVLLLGNGISRINTYDDEYSLKKIIRKWCNTENNLDEVPFPILTMAFGNDKKALVQSFDNMNYSANDLLKQFISIGFDEILTTNYPYEIENEIDSTYINKKEKIKNAVSFYTSENGKLRRENKIMIQTFNRLWDNSNTEYHIWHIHGELRSSTSLVLTHDDYERLVTKIGNYLKKNHSEYVNNKQNYRFESWIDYLLYGEVYIVGLGLYFSEYDLWWLLNERRKKNVRHKIIYYEPFSDKEFYKQEMLKQMGVIVKNLDCVKTEKKQFDYKAFYKEVKNDISNSI